MFTKTVTLEEILDALGQNNIPVAVGQLTIPGARRAGGQQVIGSACALGQCAINLGVSEHDLQGALTKLRTKGGEYVASYIISMNDTYKKSPTEVAEKVRKNLTSDDLSRIFTLPTKFSVVIVKSS